MIERLLEAIYASPDDDAPRLVYADALLERGDPRGELIVRQCRGDAALDLIEQHGERWLRELAPYLRTSVFERGFLAKATLRDLSASDIKGAVGHPVLRTVRELRGPAVVAIDPVMGSLRVLHLTQHRWSSDRYKRELFVGAPRDLVELHYELEIEETWVPDNDDGHWLQSVPATELELLACSALPKLERLVLTGIPLGWISAVVSRTPFERVVVDAISAQLHVGIRGGVATITVEPTAESFYTDFVFELVRDLPGQLSIALDTKPNFLGRAVLERQLGSRLVRSP